METQFNGAIGKMLAAHEEDLIEDPERLSNEFISSIILHCKEERVLTKTLHSSEYPKRTFTQEHRKNLSDAKKGRPSPNKGKQMSDEQKRKLSLAAQNCSLDTRKKLSDAHRGERHYNWRGGVSYEPYCIKFNAEFKERVREFFGRKCVECGVPENGRRLCVHHVNFRKDACCDESVKPLFVPLCQKCHSKTTYNRSYWELHFTEIIKKEYNGQCFLPKS